MDNSDLVAACKLAVEKLELTGLLNDKVKGSAQLKGTASLSRLKIGFMQDS